MGVSIVKSLVGVLVAFVAVGFSVVTAGAAAEIDVSKIYSPGQIVSPTQVSVATKATCAPGDRRADFSLRLQESTVNGTTTGTGDSGNLICDGSEHRYVVDVNAASGTWITGPVQVYVATAYTRCTETPTGPNCVTDATPYQYVTTIQLESRS